MYYSLVAFNCSDDDELLLINTCSGDDGYARQKGRERIK